MSKVRFIKGKCESGIVFGNINGIGECQRPAMYNLYHTEEDGTKVFKDVCDQCVLIIEEDNERLWTEAMYRRHIQ